MTTDNLTNDSGGIDVAFGQRRTEVTGHSIRRGSSKDVKVSPKVGRAGLEPATNGL